MGVQSRILGITPMFDERDQQEFLAAGVDEFIEKPLSPEILIPILMELDNQIWRVRIKIARGLIVMLILSYSTFIFIYVVLLGWCTQLS